MEDLSVDGRKCNSKTFLKRNRTQGHVLDECGQEQGPGTVSCEHNSDLSGVIGDGHFLTS